MTGMEKLFYKSSLQQFFLPLASGIPGTMGLIVRTENTGTVVFPSDAVYNHFNYGPPAMKSGMCARPEEFVGSIEKVRQIVDGENGKLFYSHDVETFGDYKKSPKWYD